MNNNSSIESSKSDSTSCTKCGISLKKSLKFCTSCGENLQVQVKTQNFDASEMVAVDSVLEGSPGFKSSKALLMLVIFISSVIGAIYAVAQLNKGNAASVKEKSSESLVAAKQSAQPLATYSLRKLAEMCSSIQVLNKTIRTVMY